MNIIFLIGTSILFNLNLCEPIVVCSLNTNRFSEAESTNIAQAELLLKDAAAHNCSILAIQELYGKNKKQAEKNLLLLKSAFSQMKGESILSSLGRTNDNNLRNAFLYEEDKWLVKSEKTFNKMSLPKLKARAPSIRFSRGPHMLALSLRKDNCGCDISNIAFFSFHLKSKRGGWKDPTKSNFETLRMQMAQGLKNLSEVYEEKGYLPILLGDRNSTPDSPSAAILRGDLKLKDFSSGLCRLDNEHKASCKVTKNQGDLSGVLHRSLTSDKGSYNHKGKWELIDEILLPKEELNRFESKDIQAGFGEVRQGGSDHLLIWTAIPCKIQKPTKSH